MPKHLKAQEIAKTKIEGNAVAHLCDVAITEDTLRKYTGRIVQLTEWMRFTNNTTMTPDLFGVYLAQRAAIAKSRGEGCGKSTGEGFRSALLHFQISRSLWLSPDGSAWAGSAQTIKMVRGSAYGAKSSRKRPRGTIQQEDFPAFVTWIHAYHPHLDSAVAVSYGTGLRSHALIELQDGDWCPYTHMLLYIDKTANAENGNAFFRKMHVTCPRAIAYLSYEQATAGPGKKFFPKEKWTLAQFRAAMKQAAKDLQWPDGLKFDGPHCLRHAAVAVDTGEVIPMSLQMRKHYGRSNEDRLRSVNK